MVGLGYWERGNGRGCGAEWPAWIWAMGLLMFGLYWVVGYEWGGGEGWTMSRKGETLYSQWLPRGGDGRIPSMQMEINIASETSFTPV